MRSFFFVLLLTVSLAFSFSSATNGIKKLHFYLHDMVDLNNPTNSTVVYVAGPPFGFGSLFAIDDVLTRGPSITSEFVGRAKGTYMLDDSTNTTLSLYLTFVAVLKDGTINMEGQDTTADEVREIAVTGGTGAYRFASGYAQIRTYTVIPPLSVILNVQVFYKN